MSKSFSYDSARWRRCSTQIRAKYGYLCQYCNETHLADVVDHVVELSDVNILTPTQFNHYAYSPDNLIPACHSSHNRKTAFIVKLRNENTRIYKAKNHPIIYHDNLPNIIDLTDAATLKPLIYDHLNT